MITRETLHSLSRLPQSLLTVYLNTMSTEASQHTPVPSYLAWLKKEANSLVDSLPPNERGLFREQLHRVEEFLYNRAPAEKSLVIFASPKKWEVVPLQVKISNELHWESPLHLSCYGLPLSIDPIASWSWTAAARAFMATGCEK